jgi:transposase
MRFQTRGWLLTGSDQRLRLITVGSFGRGYKGMGGGSGLAGISIENTNILLTVCGQCGKTGQVEAPWTRKGSGFTLLMEAFIVALCRQMPMAVVARMLGVSGDHIARTLDHHVSEARAKESHAEVTQLAVDERSARRGQRFLTLFHDPAERRILFATPGRDAATFTAFVNDLKAHGGDASAITTVSMDMSKAYQAGARKQCPNATLCFDPFHVIALGQSAMEQVRHAETKDRPELKGSRWALLKDAAYWNARQIPCQQSFPSWQKVCCACKKLS